MKTERWISLHRSFQPEIIEISNGFPMFTRCFCFSLLWLSSLVSVSRAEFMLYIKETNLTTNVVTELPVQDGDSVFETDLGLESVDFIDLDVSALEAHFEGRWTFGAFFQATSTLGQNLLSGVPAQIINLAFDAQSKLTNTANYSLEVLVTYIGNNGADGKTYVEYYGGGTASTQSYEFVAAYSHDLDDVFFTNSYLPDDGPERFVSTEVPPLAPNKEYSSLNSQSEIVGKNLYALTYGVRILSIAPGEYFTLQGGVEYLIPEPMSLATWAVLGLSLYRFRHRKNLARKISAE
jgi:hypothetical protein